MLSVEVNSVSVVKPSAVVVDLTDSTLLNTKTLFPGGCTLCFVDALSGLTDIRVKNYTTFYLTREMQLDNVIKTDITTLTATSLNTTLKARSGSFIIPDQNPLYGNTSTDIDLTTLSNTSDINYVFRIMFINANTCRVAYSDSAYKRYLTVNSSKKVVLRKAQTIVDADSIWNYLLKEDKLILSKQILGVTYTLTNIGTTISAVNFTDNLFENIKNSALTVNSLAAIELQSPVLADYVTYADSSLAVNSAETVVGVPVNYLLSRTSYNDGEYSVTSLKNYAAENGKYGRFNTLGLSGADSRILNRVYTSINSNIDQLEDKSLSLNYVCYNQAYSILPGLNTIAIGETMHPFERLNVNDTTFIDSGSYGSISPAYSDKIYYDVENNKGEQLRYLCTWLYNDSQTGKYIWLDRYYYPNLITKSQSLVGEIYNPTYDNYIESIIKANLNNQFDDLSATQFFDKLSDLAFKPNEKYVYDRIDLNNLEFIVEKNKYNSKPGYYSTINEKDGFTLAFKLNQYTDDAIIVIESRFNRIPGGIIIAYNQNEVNISVSLFNYLNEKTVFKYKGVLGRRSQSTVILHVDNLKGAVLCFLDNNPVINKTFNPLTYANVLYGDIFVADSPLSNSSNYISDVFLSTEPLSDIQLELLRTKYSSFNNNLTISLPCGMRNCVDSISQIQTINAATISKSNAFDINIDNLNISSEDKIALRKAIEIELNSLLPTNSLINNIKIT